MKLKKMKYIGRICIISILFLLSIPISSAASGNLAPNSGFETDPAIEYFTNGNAAFTWATAGHTGSRSVKIVSIQPTGSYSRWLSKTNKISGQAGNVYSASAWMKTVSVAQYGRLVINFWDESLNYLGGSESVASVKGTTYWTQLSVQAIAPSNTAFVRIEFRLYGPGTLWIDDVDLRLKTATSTPLSVLTPSGSYTLLWNDEFSSNSLSSDWRVFGNNQGGATSDTLFSSSMVKVSNGQLHLGIAMNPSSGRKYIGGGVDNLNSIAGKLKQGRWEIRAKMPPGFGTNGYFGLYGSSGEWPPEIVIAETFGKTPARSSLAQTYDLYAAIKYDSTEVIRSNPDWTEEFNVYAFEWNGNQLRWYINGQLKKTSTQRFTTIPMKFSAGAWSGICGSNWPDCASSNILPAYLDIDYVRIYRKY